MHKKLHGAKVKNRTERRDVNNVKYLYKWVFFLTLCSLCALAAEPAMQDVSDEPIVKILMNRDSLKQYYVCIMDSESGVFFRL